MLSLVQRKALYPLGAGMALGLMTMSAQAGPSAGGLKLEADAMPVQRVASRQVAGPGRHFRHFQFVFEVHNCHGGAVRVTGRRGRLHNNVRSSPESVRAPVLTRVAEKQ